MMAKKTMASWVLGGRAWAQCGHLGLAHLQKGMYPKMSLTKRMVRKISRRYADTFLVRIFDGQTRSRNRMKESRSHHQVPSYKKMFHSLWKLKDLVEAAFL